MDILTSSLYNKEKENDIEIKKGMTYVERVGLFNRKPKMIKIVYKERNDKDGK